MKDRIKSLRLRIILIIMGVGILAGAILYVGVLRAYENRAVSLRTAEIQNQCTILCDQLNKDQYLMDPTSEVINTSLDQLTNIYTGRVMIIDQDLYVVKDTFEIDEGKTIVSENVIQCMEGENASYYDQNDHYIEVTSAILNDQDEISGVMLATVSTDMIEDTMQVLRSRGMAILGIVFVILLVVAFLLADRMVRPLRRLRTEIEGIVEGYEEEVPVEDSYTEAAQISEAINQMLERMRQVNDSMEEFVSNVSHELKTPLTSMKVLADSLLIQDDVPVELYQEFMQDIAEEIDHENDIITDLLSLVKMNRSSPDLNIQSVDINVLLEEILKRLKPIAEENQIEIVLESFRPVTAEVDETKFSSAISNLVENAIKYNHENGWVHVSLNADHKYFYVKVADSGVGIPKEDQDHIFERFYRVDKSHSQESGGTGLGLSIARSAIILHRGSIKVYSEPGEGTTFTVRVPLIFASPEGGKS